MNFLFEIGWYTYLGYKEASVLRTFPEVAARLWSSHPSRTIVENPQNFMPPMFHGMVLNHWMFRNSIQYLKMLKEFMQYNISAS